MLSEQPATAPRRACDAAGGGDPGEVSDQQLLELFATQKDEAAFAALVHRHGPLVLAVCRRVLGPGPDVEDAFQATFLVLVQKAARLRRPELLANWLYGVAYRIARKLRTTAETRRRHEARKLHPVFTLTEPGAEELRPILDEELHRLPEKYRVAVVLCYLQGKTNEEAAQQLHWPTGTVKGRLARARDLLRSRLVRRGVTLSGAALAWCLDSSVAHAGELRDEVGETTIRAGLGLLRGDVTTSSPLALRTAQALLQAERRQWWATLGMLLLTSVLVLFAGATVVAACFPDLGEDRPCHHGATPRSVPAAP